MHKHSHWEVGGASLTVLNYCCSWKAFLSRFSPRCDGLAPLTYPAGLCTFQKTRSILPHVSKTKCWVFLSNTLRRRLQWPCEKIDIAVSGHNWIMSRFWHCSFQKFIISTTSLIISMTSNNSLVDVWFVIAWFLFSGPHIMIIIIILNKPTVYITSYFCQSVTPVA